MGTIRQYMAWMEKRIARLVIQEGLHVGLLKVIQGPLTITFQVRLLQPSRMAVNKLLKLSDAIAEAIQTESVRIARVDGTFSIEIPSPIKRTPSGAELLRHSRGIQICVGLDSLRRPVHVDLRQHGALLWVGPSRRGKTHSMKCALYCLARQKGARLKYVILCHERKRQDWRPFARAVGCMGIVTSAAEHQCVLQWVSTKLLKLRTPFTFIIVVDDLLNLLSEAPEMATDLAKLSSLGAGLGIHLWAGTQEAGSKRGTGGEGVEANASAKILYKATSKARAARNAGQGELNLMALTGAKGDAVLLIDGVATRIATGYADDRDIMQLPTGPQYEAPWREQTTGTQTPQTEDKGSTCTGTPTNGTHNGACGTATVLSAHPLPNPIPTSSADESQIANGKSSTGGTNDTLVEYKLADQEPDAKERAYLRTLYQKYGSKNQVLKVAWGGVVNLDGKTPKTWKWLQAALAEVSESGEHTAQDNTHLNVALQKGDTPAIDMNTEVGQAAIDLLVAHGLLPSDKITEVVSYRQQRGSCTS